MKAKTKISYVTNYYLLAKISLGRNCGRLKMHRLTLHRMKCPDTRFLSRRFVRLESNNKVLEGVNLRFTDNEKPVALSRVLFFEVNLRGCYIVF